MARSCPQAGVRHSASGRVGSDRVGALGASAAREGTLKEVQKVHNDLVHSSRWTVSDNAMRLMHIMPALSVHMIHGR